MIQAFEVVDASADPSSPRKHLVFAKDIRAFKKWTVFPISRLNIFTGPNSAGKSTALELIYHLWNRRFDRVHHLSSSETCWFGFSFDWKTFTDKKETIGTGSPFSLEFLFPFMEEIEKDLEDYPSETYRRFTYVIGCSKNISSLDWAFYIFGDNQCLATFESNDQEVTLQISRNLCNAQFANEKSTTIFELFTELPTIPISTYRSEVWWRRITDESLKNTLAISFGDQEPYALSLKPEIQFGVNQNFIIAYPDSNCFPEDFAKITILLEIWFWTWFEYDYPSPVPIPAIRSVPKSESVRFHFTKAPLGSHMVIQKSTVKYDSYDPLFEEVAIGAAENPNRFVKLVNCWMAKMLDTDCKLTAKMTESVPPNGRKDSKVLSNRTNEEQEIVVALSLRIKETKPVSFASVGTGISQVLPVIGLAFSSTQRLKIFHQPELHLHPKAQAILGDLFLESIKKGSRILIETHSEHLILRILRRIAESRKSKSVRKLNQDGIRLTYCNPTSDGVEAHWIRVDEYGQFIDPWPSGFFEERYEDLFPVFPK